jgi:hypothetical protein
VDHLTHSASEHPNGGPPAAHAVAPWGRRETELERVDRNLVELVQEIRVVQTGVQVLFAFLLTVPFTAGFEDATAIQRGLLFAAVLLAGLSATLLIAPSALHRMVFRRGDKDYLLRMSNRYAIAGLAAVAATLTCAVALVTDVLYGWPLVLPTTLVTGGGLLVLWFALPLRRRRRGADDLEPFRGSRGPSGG